MTLAIADLRQAWELANVKALSQVVRHGESTHGDAAYTVVNGGSHFTDFSKHPYEGLRTTEGGKACGAYQIIPTTWAGLVKQYGFSDFSPSSQDLAFVALVAGRHALEDVIAGRVTDAIEKCRPEWTSLPGAAENSGRYTMDMALQLYQQYGGTTQAHETMPLPQVEVPPLNTAPAPQPKQDKPMLPFLFPLLAELIPQLAKILMPTGGGEVAQRNQALANVAINAVVDTVKSETKRDDVTPTQAVAAIAADPELLAKVTQAVLTQTDIMQVLEIGGGIEKAREYGLQVQNSERTFLWNPTFWITLMMLPLVGYIIFAVLTGGAQNAPWWVGSGFTPETKASNTAFVLGAILGGIMGMWFGTNFSSKTKDDTIKNLSQP
jgi:muramidase (phage lysozyme)